MNKLNIKKYFLVALVLILVLGLLIFSVDRAKKPKTTTTNTSPNQSAGVDKPPQALAVVVTKYLQAREDSVGANQTTPNSWTIGVKSITTPSWYSQLQPTTSPTSTVSSDYIVAHSNSWIVKAKISDCIWDITLMHSTVNAKSGIVLCSVYDTTVNQSGGEAVGTQSLPYGWVHGGQQEPAQIGVTNQNGVWLVDDDTTGLGN